MTTDPYAAARAAYAALGLAFDEAEYLAARVRRTRRSDIRLRRPVR